MDSKKPGIGDPWEIQIAEGSKRRRPFYLESIITAARQFLWTTNVAAYSGSFGRRSDQDILEAHRSAHERGVSLTRLFIVDKDGFSNAEATIEAQRGAGVEVWMMQDDSFQRILSANEDSLKSIGSSDFMIFDDLLTNGLLTYVTYLDADQKTTLSVSLSNSPERLLAALHLRTCIMEEAIPFDDFKRLFGSK
jgi:hypothetical protein